VKRLSFLILVVCLAALIVVVVYPRRRSVFKACLVSPEATTETEDMSFKNTKTGTTDTLHVSKRRAIDQSMVRSAALKTVAVLPGAFVEVKLTEQGRKRLAEITRDNVGKRLALIIDREVVVAPKILEERSEGTVWIVGDFTVREADELAARISSGLKQ